MLRFLKQGRRSAVAFGAFSGRLAFPDGAAWLSTGRNKTLSVANARSLVSAEPGGAGDKAHQESEPMKVSGRTVSPITQQLWTKRAKLDILGETGGKEQAELIPKPPEFVSVTFPFSDDPVLVEQYRSPWGFVRLGRILEDLDSLAGNIAHRHCDDNDPETMPPLLVTAGVEKIALSRQMRLDQDMVLRGRVVWVGKSSMDIRMEVVNSAGQDCLVAHFFFVARNPITKRSMPINPLQPKTEVDKEAFQDGVMRAAERKRKMKSAAEGGLDGGDARKQEWIRNVMERSQTALDMPALIPSGWIWRRDTAHENMLMCQPQQRNMAGRIFGGFLMRRAFELAFATCYSFAGSRPAFLLVDDISFQKPVDVSDLLRLKSSVLHVEHMYNPGPPWLKARNSHAVVHIEVTALVVKPEEASSSVTNTFTFRFAVDNTAKPLKSVIPHTRDEAVEMYTAASQHFDEERTGGAHP